MRIRRLHCPAFALALLAASLFANGAQAFTIEELGSASSGDGARNAIADPDGRVSRFGSSGNTYKQGNTTLQFGTQQRGGDRYFNTDHMFNPNGRPYGER